MRRKLFVLWITLVLLLSGCTPAAGNTANVNTSEIALSNTTEGPAQTTEESARTETTVEETTSIKEIFPAEEVTIDSLTTYPVPPMSSSIPSTAPPEDGPWGTYRDWTTIPFDDRSISDDVNFVPNFSEGGTPDRFITDAYDALDFVFTFQNQGAIRLDDNCFVTACMLNGIRFPIECARKIDDDRCYIVYKVQQGGYGYLFFKSFQSMGHRHMS